MKVLFLGAGVFGEALASLAKENQHDVSFYDPYKYPDISLSEAIKNVDIAVYVAPASAEKEILPNLPNDLPLICASKGFISLKPFQKFNDFSALGGAAFAEEIKAKKSFSNQPIVLTSSTKTAKSLFESDYLRIEYTTDTEGIMLCGSLKNVYAIGAGLYQDDNYIEKVTPEIEEFLAQNGCDKNTANLSCGISDLKLTCTPNSRNYRFGELLRNMPEKIDPSETIEGLTVIKTIENYPDFIIPNDAKIFKEIVKKVLEKN